MDPAWREVLAQKQGVTEMLRAIKPLMQREIEEHARTKGASS